MLRMHAHEDLGLKAPQAFTATDSFVIPFVKLTGVYNLEKQIVGVIMLHTT